MGYVSHMERRAQQALLKRAMEGAWTAGNCMGMVFGPLCVALEAALEAGKAGKIDVELLIDEWLEAWRVVRHLSDRNLKRNRDHYVVRPNMVLSPILLKFQERLESIRHSSDMDAPTMLAKVNDTMFTTFKDLFEFNGWAKSVGPLIAFDTVKYEPAAVRRGQRFWERTAREFYKA